MPPEPSPSAAASAANGSLSRDASHPRVSLIICTRNRAAQLPECLAKLAQLESPPGGWELVLVDNGSSDGTRELIESFARSTPATVKYVLAPVPGLARARNAGLDAARGGILAFTDDDCYPSADYLKALVDIFDEFGPGFVGGRVLLYDPKDAPVAIKELMRPLDIPPHCYLKPGIIHGANMAVSRDVVDAIGGFDPHLGAGTRCVAGEDIDYLARAAWAGWRGRYDPRLVVAHHHGRQPGAAADAHKRGYDVGRGAYYIKFVMRSDSRNQYLGHWSRRARREAGFSTMGRRWREILGAARYVTVSLLRPEPYEHVGRPADS